MDILITILLAVLVLIIVAFAIKKAADYCEVEPPIRNIVLLIVFLIFLVYVLRSTGIVKI